MGIKGCGKSDENAIAEHNDEFERQRQAFKIEENRGGREA